MILNRAKDYYENDKKRLREQERDKYRDSSEEDRNKKREYGRNRYYNMSEEKKRVTVRLKSLNLIINMFYGFNSVCYDLVIHY